MRKLDDDGILSKSIPSLAFVHRSGSNKLTAIKVCISIQIMLELVGENCPAMRVDSFQSRQETPTALGIFYMALSLLCAAIHSSLGWSRAGIFQARDTLSTLFSLYTALPCLQYVCRYTIVSEALEKALGAVLVKDLGLTGDMYGLVTGGCWRCRSRA